MSNTAKLIHYFPAILAALLASMFVLITTTNPTPPLSELPPGGCADAVISFSPCLPYISSPPNDLSDNPSSQCCDVYTSAFDSGEAGCLCYLVCQNTLLGFPINVTKLLSLSDLCFVKNNGSLGILDSLSSVCAASPTLPPLVGSTTTGTPRSQNSSSNAPPPPRGTMTPGSANRPSRQPSTSQQQSNHGSQLSSAAVGFLIYAFFCPLIAQ